MTEPVIRPAVDADAAALGGLGRQTFIDTFVDGFAIPYPADDLTAFLDASFSPETIRTKLQEPGAAWWVAERDGALLAFANTGPNTLPHPDARPSHAELRPQLERAGQLADRPFGIAELGGADVG